MNELQRAARRKLDDLLSTQKTASLKTMHKFADDRFSKAIEQIAKNSVNNAIKNDTIAKAKSFGLTGLGLGALSGLGYTYFNSDEDNPSSVSDYIKNGLIGSGIGGVSGAGIGALNGLIPGYRSRTDRINNIIQEAKDHGKMWAHSMEENNGYLNFSGKDRNWDGTIMEKIDDLVLDHNKKIRDKYGPLKNQYYENSRNNDNKIQRVFADLDNYVPGTGKGEMDGGFRNGRDLHDWLGRIDAFINSGILNKHEADVVRNYVKDINPFDFTYDDLGNVIRAIESSQGARREKAINRLYNYLSTQKTASIKTADFSLSDLGTKLKSFANDYKWPLIGTAAVGIPAIAAITLANHAAETSPEYADPRYMNEDGSLLPSFTTIRPLQNENIEHLEELIDEKALNKFFANNFNRFNYVKNQDDTYSHVGNTPEWEDEADIYDAYEKEIFGKGGPGHWGYLNDDELPSIEDAKALGFLDHLISTKPYYEGQKPISKTASLKTADFKTRFGQDLGGFLSHMAYGGVGGALLGGLYHGIAGGTPDDLVSDMNTGMNIGAALSGLYGGINTHIGMNDRIKKLGDLLSRRFTSGVSPAYQARTDNLKNILNNLTNGGFMAGLKEVF